MGYLPVSTQVGGIDHRMLYSQSRIGTKHLVASFVDEVRRLRRCNGGDAVQRSRRRCNRSAALFVLCCWFVCVSGGW